MINYFKFNSSLEKFFSKNLKLRIHSILFLLLFSPFVFGQTTTETISSGSYIINMGVVPQTIGNGLKPYGMIYDLIANYKVPIKWVIAPGKVKDGVDFTYNGVDYKGGPFIILNEYRSTAVNARITYWETQGVIGTTITSPISVPVAKTLLVTSVPRWTLDLQNGPVAVPYFANAGIPTTAYSITKLPSQLGYCDDIFVMPHADPQWSTHQNLYFWNQTYHGSIWTNCHAGSTLEDMFNPANPSQQTNFLAEKTGTATGVGPYSENALFLYSSHTSGTPPYLYDNHSDPYMQFIGPIDAATQNGSEQIYIPLAPGWRPTTTIAVWDPDHVKPVDKALNHRAAVVAYGRAFGDESRGYVMIEAAHSFNKATLPPNIAAQRIFFNFSFMTGKNATITPDVSGFPSAVTSGSPIPVSFTFPVGINSNDYTVSFSSACGGSFSADPAYPGDKTKAIFTPPVASSTIDCPISVSIGDACGRVFNTSKTSVVSCDVSIVTSLSNACFGASDGKIVMTITGASGPYLWSWVKTGGGTGSGTGTTISNLSPGNYTVTVTTGNGSGCVKSFTVVIGQNTAISPLTLTPTNINCFGINTGSILVSAVSGGSAPYTYLWSDAVTTQNRNSLASGTYSLTVTDANGCKVSASSTITQPAEISITPTFTNVNCYGDATGVISIATTNGISPLKYLWNDGVSTVGRTDLKAGIYTLQVTDASNCVKTSSLITISEPVSTLTVSSVNTNIACYSVSSGSIDLIVSGGTSPYVYNWGTSITTQDRTSLPAGNYSVIVTDSKNCTSTYTTALSQATALNLSSTIVHESCSNALDGSIVLTVSGGTSGYSYSWSGPNAFSATTASITGLKTGIYTVVVTDSVGCTETKTFTINTINPSPSAPATIGY